MNRSRPRTRRVGFLIYSRFTGLDLVGPMEVFATANELRRATTSRRSAPYELCIIAPGERPVVAESGLAVLPQFRLAQAPTLDTLLIPGGAGLREAAQLKPIAQWLRRRHGGIRRIASVCTGVWALAEAGLLTDRAATTHWRYAAKLAARYPAVRVDPNAIFIQQGKVFTSAGISAGIDLALALVELDLGSELALAVARELVVPLRRSGGQQQYSNRLAMLAGPGQPFASLCAWMQAHLDEDLPLSRLAEQVHLSERQLTRRFKHDFGVTPSAYLERLRIDEASQLLLSSTKQLEHIARTVGYGSVDVLRRAFERQLGVTPSEYRARFQVKE